MSTQVKKTRKGATTPFQFTQIKTFENACKHLKIEKLPTFTAWPPEHREYAAANFKLVIIAQALNNGWKPDWNNSNQYKYWPYFKKSETGFAFVDSVYAYWGTYAIVGSRLCLPSSELAEYFGKQFIDLHNQVLAY